MPSDCVKSGPGKPLCMIRQQPILPAQASVGRVFRIPLLPATQTRGRSGKNKSGLEALKQLNQVLPTAGTQGLHDLGEQGIEITASAQPAENALHRMLHRRIDRRFLCLAGI